ncbi:Programmed cell death protein 2 [Gracilariopsis chorda]|uniref:Programmed cell death protein 2 n=1 Tax=Gracilariopsis chorda TaxID=448386 RepID=A0A2V3IW27_9FLOR|nr:Programmed cell death protein 2 [Gracilariopsis chorda]|eukprot:PXF46285.1 Programmed cell death protein 2 [Gracilariopsis chorda]
MSASVAYDDTVLGFAEPPDEGTNLPQSFASKAGGLPVWLHRPPASPPPAPNCRVCNQPQQFLLQINAPLEPDVVAHDHAFHRVLTLAICRNPGCRTNSSCVSVLRAQLPRTNPYYPWDADDQCVEELMLDACHVCGFLANMRCGGCRKLMYCGRLCQMRHWKNGHKSSCGQPMQNASDLFSALRFSEVEIVTDNHPRMPASDIDDDDEDERSNDELETNQLDQPDTPIASTKHNANHRSTKPPKHSSPDVSNQTIDQSSLKPSNNNASCLLSESPQSSTHTSVIEPEIKGTFQDADEEELPEDLFEPRPGRVKDPVFEKFSRVVSYAPDQVVRYHHGGQELWGCKSNQCHSVPDCELCGSKRIFEMQVMPQLVYYIAEPDKNNATIKRVAERLRDDMDWITICVYTCEKSCTADDAYVPEFAWLQRHPTS